MMNPCRLYFSNLNRSPFLIVFTALYLCTSSVSLDYELSFVLEKPADKLREPYKGLTVPLETRAARKKLPEYGYSEANASASATQTVVTKHLHWWSLKEPLTVQMS